jgi:uncharacterized protein YjbI with pentapeptide repeats
MVRITGPGGTVGGLGALVAARQVVTCAHVVNVALGRDALAQAQPRERVLVEFPLLDGSAGASIEADVVMWRPPSPAVGVASDDLAGLELTGGQLPPGAVPGRLAVEPPRAARSASIFGYPATTSRPDGIWVATSIRGLVANGRLQLDSTLDSASRVEPGFSGSPVLDDTSGRIAGLLVVAPRPQAQLRDSYAVSAERLRLAWPDVLAGRWQPGAGAARRRESGELTILHLSDLRFDRDRLTGAQGTGVSGAGISGAGISGAGVSGAGVSGAGVSGADRAEHPLFGRLHADIAGLAAEAGLRPDLLVVTGNLAERGLPVEFAEAASFIGALAEEAEIPRQHVAIVPGGHDVNRLTCQAYFLQEEGAGREPAAPYWPKWQHYVDAFRDFYAGIGGVTFTPDEPWTLFEMEDLAVVVAGLNSTMADSHREADHHGEIGARQLRWFATRLAERKEQGWLRLGALHHHVAAGTYPAESGIRDASDLDRVLGHEKLLNVVLHGQTPDAVLHRLPSGLVALSAGSAAVSAEGTSAQYQLVTVRRDGLTRAGRQYAAGHRRWVGDTRISVTGTDWRDRVRCELADVDRALPPTPGGTVAGSADADGIDMGEFGGDGDRRGAAFENPSTRFAGSRPTPRASDFFDRVTDATKAKAAGAVITERPEDGYLRVTVSRGGGQVEQWPVGVIDGQATEETIGDFVQRVHRQFAADIPAVRSVLVYRPPAVAAALVGSASRRGVLLQSLVEYQGMIDLGPLAEAQRERLANDRIYPAGMYVDQRYRIVSGGGHTDEVRTGLIDRAVHWLGDESARLVVVLGDFGRGKTSFLRQLTRELPVRLPSVTPVLVELRSLEKAPSLDELLAQHLARQGVDDINLTRLRYMIGSGRIALLLDGFDELELRVGYENAADYLQTLLFSLTAEAKVILTSRTQHFRSVRQVRDALSGRIGTAGRTALGERVETRPESRVVVLEEFSEGQILEFLTNLYNGDTDRARARFGLIRGIGNLLDLSHNPRMLGFVADLEEERLRDAQNAAGEISTASLYETIIDQWLDNEADRHRHRAGLPSITKEERLAACAALALRLWASKDPTIALAELSAEVARTLDGLAERGFTEEQAAHSIASGSLLIRTDDGAFAFIHQSVMEWLVAKAAATQLDLGRGRSILASRRMSRLMVTFFADLAGPRDARGWADAALADPDASEAAKQNALAVMDYAAAPPVDGSATAETSPAGRARQNLARVDLRGQDLTRRDLRGADLRGAILRDMRLDGVDLTGADLTGADFSGVVMREGSLRGAVITGSMWARAALLGAEGLADPETAGAPELATAAVVGRDAAEVMVAPPRRPAQCVAFSPDGVLLAYGEGNVVKVADIGRGTVQRVIRGHDGAVNAVAFSPDGTLLATASDDRTARTWDTATGTPRTTLTGHDSWVTAVAFSPDGTLLATASGDGTARTWDTATGTPRTTLTGHDSSVTAVAFSPDGTLLATASWDGTARTWDTATGTPRTTLTGHDSPVTAVAFSPDGTLLATASNDNTARTWDTATGTPRTTLTGHTDWVRAAAFSPDGTLLATASDDGTTRVWDAYSGAHLATLVALSGGGYATLLPDGGYKIGGEPGDDIWWAVKLCRFGAGELDPYVPGMRQLEAGEVVVPPRDRRVRGGEEPRSVRDR